MEDPATDTIPVLEPLECSWAGHRFPGTIPAADWALDATEYRCTVEISAIFDA